MPPRYTHNIKVLQPLAGSIIILLIMLLCVKPALAQDDAIYCYLSDKALTIRNGEIVDLNVVVKNNTPFDNITIIQLQPNSELNLLTRLPPYVEIAAGDSIFLPVKYYVPESLPANSKSTIKVLFKDLDSTVFMTDNCVVTIEKDRRVYSFTVQDDLLLEKDTDSLSMPLRLQNNGNTYEFVTVIARFPRLANTDFVPLARFEMRPFTDTVIYCKRKTLKEMYKMSEFPVSINILFADGNIVGMHSMNVQVARSVRSFKENIRGDKEHDGTPNTVTLAGRYFGTPQQSYQAFGGSSIQLNKSMIRYMFDLTYWQNGNTKPVARNTYVNYDAKNFGIVAGTINRTFDVNLTGKGGAIYLQDNKKSNRVETGYIISGYNLIAGERVVQNYLRGQSAWANYVHIGKKLSYKLNGVYDETQFSNTKSSIASTEVTYNDKSHQLTLIGAGGYAQDNLNTVASRPSYAAGLNYSFYHKSINFTTHNYSSSAYFPGYKRGALLTDYRLGVTASKHISAYGSYVNNNFTPAMLPGIIGNYTPVFGVRRAEIGIDLFGIGNFSATLAANNNRESNNYGEIYGMPGINDMTSNHGSLTLRYSNSDKQMFAAASSESGYYTSSILPGQKFHSKNTLTFKIGAFSLSGYYQLGYYYLTEIVNSLRFPTNSFSMYNISPMVQHTFKKKLDVLATVNYNSSSQFGQNIMALVSVGYHITSRTRVYALNNSNRFISNGITTDIHNPEFGIQQELPQIFLKGNGGNKLDIFVYKDVNKSGKFDEGDSIASNRMININGMLMVTGFNGRATFKNLPDSTYEIFVQPNKEWYAPRKNVNIQKSASIEIPMQQTSKITGNIHYQYDQYSYDVTKKMEGVIIVAQSESETFTTRTDDNGKFTFYIPAGTFTVMVKKETVAKEVECVNNNQVVFVDNSTNADVGLLLQVKQRKVNVKKFTSMNK